MKKTQEILGLPVISISDGYEAGRVKGILVNGETGSVDYIVVDKGIQIYGARIIPSSEILGVGEDALTIEKESVIVDINQVPAAVQQLEKDIQIKGTKVLTKKGKIIGEIGDFYVDDEDHFAISGLEFLTGSLKMETRIIPRKSVITFGKTLTIVENDVEGSLLNLPEELPTDDNESSSEGTPHDVNFSDKLDTPPAYAEQEQEDAALSSISRDFAKAADESRNADENRQGEESPQPAAAQTQASGSSASQLFEQRQRQYLNGRRATKTITDNFGNVIIAEGTVITDSIIDEVKAKGKLIELVMNNKG